jgi:hypothetical protein
MGPWIAERQVLNLPRVIYENTQEKHPKSIAGQSPISSSIGVISD